MSEYLFTYGTLQPGHAPAEIADVVRDLLIVGKGTIPGTLYDLGSYPGAVLDQTISRRITGTVFQLPPAIEILQRLDDYEDYDRESPGASLFIRRQCSVQLHDGRILECWVYEYNGPRDRAPIVESGAYIPD